MIRPGGLPPHDAGDPGEISEAPDAEFFRKASPMTGISSLNILVQQGGSTQEMHHVKQQLADHTQMVAAQEQMARADEAKGHVQQSGQSEKSYLSKDKSKEKKDAELSRRKKKQKKRTEEITLGSTGKLLDTVA